MTRVLLALFEAAILTSNSPLAVIDSSAEFEVLHHTYTDTNE